MKIWPELIIDHSKIFSKIFSYSCDLITDICVDSVNFAENERGREREIEEKIDGYWPEMRKYLIKIEKLPKQNEENAWPKEISKSVLRRVGFLLW